MKERKWAPYSHSAFRTRHQPRENASVLSQKVSTVICGTDAILDSPENISVYSKQAESDNDRNSNRYKVSKFIFIYTLLISSAKRHAAEPSDCLLRLCIVKVADGLAI